MRKIWIIIILLLFLPVLAYEVYDYRKFNDDNYGDKLLFVVDFSNSMGEYLEHQTKITHVKNTLYKILPSISKNTQTGIRVYGHTCNVLAFNACRSSELLVPVSYNCTNRIIDSILKLRPRGMTPITYSLKQAIKKDLAGKDGIKHIILLTDGGENCDESPCNFAMELVKTRKDIKIDVIAYDVHEKDDLSQLQCTADVTGGKFTDVRTTSQLFNSLQDLIIPHKDVQAVLYGAD